MCGALFGNTLLDDMGQNFPCADSIFSLDRRFSNVSRSADMQSQARPDGQRMTKAPDLESPFT